jgi:hypothetical protein
MFYDIGPWFEALKGNDDNDQRHQLRESTIFFVVFTSFSPDVANGGGGRIRTLELRINQGILKGDVSLYH